MIPKHPFSALVRLLPALLWLGACGVFVWLFLRLFGGVLSNPARTGLDTLFVYAFLALAAFALRMAYKEFLSELPALRADQPLPPARPQQRHNPSAPVRYPLPQPLQERLQEILGVLETAGILQPGEVSLGEIIELAEVNDEYESIDIVDFTRPGDERRYVVAGFDQEVIISYLAPENVPALNRALSEDLAWFEVLESVDSE